MTRCAARAVLSVVRPQILRLWTATMPSTDANVSWTTLKLTSLGMPEIEIPCVKSERK
jgi:hypothetical protein